QHRTAPGLADFRAIRLRHPVRLRRHAGRGPGLGSGRRSGALRASALPALAPLSGPPAAGLVVLGYRGDQRRDPPDRDAPVLAVTRFGIDLEILLAIALGDEIFRRKLVI